MKKIIFLIMLSTFIFLIEYKCYSIPAFARQFKLSCQTCHIPAPKLKPYGEEFASNGFKFKDKEIPRYFQETGDEKLSLLREFPIAVRLDLNASFNNSSKERLDFAVPYILKLLSGGNITNNISYYFYFYFSERGSIAGIKDAFLMFTNLFGIDLNCQIGQFQISDPLFNRSLRLTLEDYDIYQTKVGLSDANLTYDRGIMLNYDLGIGTEFAFQIMNGNGVKAADGLKLFDNDNYKSYFLRISQDIFNFIRIGGFAYLGSQEVSNQNLSSKSDYEFYGPDLSIDYENYIQLNLQILFRKDKNIILNSNSTEISPVIKTFGGFLELVVTPYVDDTGPYGVFLINYIDSDESILNKQSYTIHLGHSIRRNLRFFVEYVINNTNLYGNYSKGLIGLVTAF